MRLKLCLPHFAAALAALGGSVATAQTVRPVPLISDLRQQTGQASDVCIVSGYGKPGDGGGGTFVWSSSLTPEQDNGGTLFAVGSGGGWQRLDATPLRAAWFGATPLPAITDATPENAEACTAALEKALKAAAGQKLLLDAGIYPVSRTLLIAPGTTLTGQGAFDQWSDTKMGTTLHTFGPGNPQKWSDSGTTDVLTPLLVATGNNVLVEQLGVITATSPDDRWDVGLLFPSVKRCAMEYVNARGWWKLAAVLLDASWSEKNESLTSLHPTIQTSSLNEFLMYRCQVEGRWGLMVRGNLVKDPRNSSGDWIHSPGGTSDLDVIACRLGTDGPRSELKEDGGAYFNSAPMLNAARAGQEHRFVACSFRVSSKYAIYLDYTNRDKFFGCYGETIYKKDRVQAMMANTANTGGVAFVGCRWNLKLDDSCWDFSRTQSVADANYQIPGNVRKKADAPVEEEVPPVPETPEATPAATP